MRIDKLRRLVRVTKLLYRQESAEVARLQGERSSLVELMESATHRLDADGASAFDASLAIAWVGRRRQELVQADARLDQQLMTASSALASAKGAESRLSSEQGELERAAEQRVLEQVIDNVVRPDSRFGQDAAYSVGVENAASADLSPRSMRGTMLRPISKDGSEE